MLLNFSWPIPPGRKLNILCRSKFTSCVQRWSLEAVSTSYFYALLLILSNILLCHSNFNFGGVKEESVLSWVLDLWCSFCLGQLHYSHWIYYVFQLRMILWQIMLGKISLYIDLEITKGSHAVSIFI